MNRSSLEPILTPQVIPKDEYNSVRTTNEVTKLNVRTMRQSWIYINAGTKDTKIAMVNAVVPINQSLECVEQIHDDGNHCVVVIGLKQWTANNQNVECLELENNGGCEQIRFIPVDHPFFKEVQIEVGRINRRYPGSEQFSKE